MMTMREVGPEGFGKKNRDWNSTELEPQHKIGPAASRRPSQGLEAERIEDHTRIARENADRIIANPNVALEARLERAGDELRAMPAWSPNARYRKSDSARRE